MFTRFSDISQSVWRASGQYSVRCMTTRCTLSVLATSMRCRSWRGPGKRGPARGGVAAGVASIDPPLIGGATTGPKRGVIGCESRPDEDYPLNYQRPVNHFLHSAHLRQTPSNPDPGLSSILLTRHRSTGSPICYLTNAELRRWHWRTAQQGPPCRGGWTGAASGLP